MQNRMAGENNVHNVHIDAPSLPSAAISISSAHRLSGIRLDRDQFQSIFTAAAAALPLRSSAFRKNSIFLNALVATLGRSPRRKAAPAKINLSQYRRAGLSGRHPQNTPAENSAFITVLAISHLHTAIKARP